jgi:hypothetical protein
VANYSVTISAARDARPAERIASLTVRNWNHRQLDAGGTLRHHPSPSRGET